MSSPAATNQRRRSTAGAGGRPALPIRGSAAQATAPLVVGGAVADEHALLLTLTGRAFGSTEQLCPRFSQSCRRRPPCFAEHNPGGKPGWPQEL
jgi:hypothetical protein